MKSFHWLFIVLVFFGSRCGFAQGFSFKDFTYVPNITSVQFHLRGLALTYPIIDLGSQNVLQFSFDDLDNQIKNYRYTIIHCNADWQPSELTDMEYIDGFTEARIEDFNYSFNTLVNYVHYELFLPNRDMAWTKSGNYLLVVSDRDNNEEVVITRRFAVVDPIVKTTAMFVTANDVSKIRTHQEIDFIVNYEGLRVRNPQQDVRATVVQNWRFDEAIQDLKPMFVRRNELIFDYQDKVVFPGGNEFRFFDLRSLQTTRNNVALIERRENRYEVTLHSDRKRMNDPYIFFNDINGQYTIENIPARDPRLRADYADVLFTLESALPRLDGSYYLFGAISDWAIKEEFKMVYNPAVSAYVIKRLLKQGFYNYAYAFVPNGTKKIQIEMDETEGNWFEATNDYTIFIYHRPFGSRYDHLVGVYTAASNAR
jgi:hypothetical protein